MTIFSELGCYTLPGHTLDPSPMLKEVGDADSLGIGSVWISERLNTKEISVLTGAAIARSKRLSVAGGVMNNLPLRNPMVTASFAATSMMLSGNRFALGIGRGVDVLETRLGIPKATDQLMEDYVAILRRLWHGEVVSYDGPAGHLQNATLGLRLEIPPPVFFGAVGFVNCELAARFCDGVLLNACWTKEGTAEAVRRIRRSAEIAGRDPDKVKIWTIVPTACEVSEEIELTTIIRRLNTYLFFPKPWQATLKVNGWDAATSQRLYEKLQEIDKQTKSGTIGDENTSRDLDDLRRMRDIWPAEWLESSTATGSAEHCAQCVLDRFDAGVDGVVLHASTPENLKPLLTVWEKIRPEKFRSARSTNPGL